MAYIEELLTADFKTSPYAHQLKEFELHGLDEYRALLWQMRCGKTKLTIDSACALYKEGRIDAVLIFAPNGVHNNWIVRELPIHAWTTINHRALDWQTKIASQASKSRKKHEEWWNEAKALLDCKDALVWMSFNSESMTRPDVRKLVGTLTNKKRTLVVFDESHNYRSPGTARTKMARAIAKRCPYRRILTGTVITNSPLHAYSQYELLKPGALGFDTYETFKNNFADYELRKNKAGRRYPALTGYKNLDDLRDKIAPFSSVVLRQDCNDMPDLVLRKRAIEFTKDQKAIYEKLRKRMLLEIEGKEISMNQAAPMLMKMQQVGSGFIIDEYGELTTIPGENPRLEALVEEVTLAPDKVIIWCQFRRDMDLVEERLTKEGFNVVSYHGRTKEEDRAKVRKLFSPNAENDIKALIGHPQSAGQGLDFSAASTIIWYTHTFDAILRGQADERATAIGGKNIQVVDIVSPGVDEYILSNVSNKVSISEAVSGTGLKAALERMRYE
jgi:SNF2 family DNA or RNA helicase